jgi:hypothetical protein
MKICICKVSILQDTYPVFLKSTGHSQEARMKSTQMKKRQDETEKCIDFGGFLRFMLSFTVLAAVLPSPPVQKFVLSYFRGNQRRSPQSPSILTLSLPLSPTQSA